MSCNKIDNNSDEPREQLTNNRQLQNMYINSKTGSDLGEGTFGKVTLGIHIPTGQKVAVKTLQK